MSSAQSFAGLLRSMSRTAFSGRQLGEALDVVLEMVRNEQCRVVLTIAGAMTVAKQGRIICDAIDRGMIDAVIATGALIAHGLTESIGCVHYRHDPSHSDETLYAQGYNRIYDTLEMESNLSDAGTLIFEVLEETKPEEGVWSSARFCRALGKRLSEQGQHHGILRSAYECGVPVFIPAFTDSDIGLVIAAWASKRWHEQQKKDPLKSTIDDVFRPVPAFNPFLDLQEYTRLVAQSKYIGILTLGGGVPRNWAQQVAPFVENTNGRLGTDFQPPRFRYGVRLCPEPVHWGGLSGCTYSEGVSWGKFMSAADGGRFAEVYADATIVFPLLMKAVFEELDREPK